MFRMRKWVGTIKGSWGERKWAQIWSILKGERELVVWAAERKMPTIGYFYS